MRTLILLLLLLLPCLALTIPSARAVDERTSVGTEAHLGEGMNVGGVSLQDLQRRVAVLEAAVSAISPTALQGGKGSSR